MLEVFLDFKIYFIYTVYSYRVKKTLHFNFCFPFLPENSKTLYRGPLIIADSLGTASVRYRQGFDCYYYYYYYYY